MFIHEIASGSNIQLFVAIGVQVLEFNTKAVEAIGNDLLAEPILKDDKMLGFSAKGLIIRIQVANSEDQKVYEWNNVQIVNVKKEDGSMYHQIMCKTPGKQVNRRGACRVWVGIDGLAQIGLSRNTHEVMIKDISISGISFICSKEVKADNGSVVHLTFLDKEVNAKFSIGAIIVRSEEIDEYSVMYGCRLNSESNAISKYINDKQREKLRASRTVG